MHKIFPLLLIIAISSCNSEDERVRKFEKVLGKQETHCLNKLVRDFDGFLENEFQGSFRAYLIAVANGQVVDNWTLDSSLHDTENNFSSTDSMSRFSIEPDIIITDQVSGLDSLRKAVKVEEIKTSKPFCGALNTIKQSDSLVLTYLNAKEAVVTIPLSSLASGLLHHYNESNIYFAKRIFVMELLGWGCW